MEMHVKFVAGVGGRFRYLLLNPYAIMTKLTQPDCNFIFINKKACDLDFLLIIFSQRFRCDGVEELLSN